jgi:hypothetical protein
VLAEAVLLWLCMVYNVDVVTSAVDRAEHRNSCPASILPAYVYFDRVLMRTYTYRRRQIVSRISDSRGPGELVVVSKGSKAKNSRKVS